MEQKDSFIVYVIDSRSFVREALCDIIKKEFGCDVFGVGRADMVSELGHFPNTLSMAIYSIGAKSCDEYIADVKTLIADNPDLRIVLLTDEFTGTEAESLPQNVIQGVIPSSYSSEQVSACLKAVSTGVTYFPQLITTREESADSDAKSEQLKSDLHPDIYRKLTPRQIEIMKLLSVGRSNKYIASELGLQENTVKVHVHDAMKRLGATSRTHASHLLHIGLSEDVV